MRGTRLHDPWSKEPWAKLCLSSPSRLNGDSCSISSQPFKVKSKNTRLDNTLIQVFINRSPNSIRYSSPRFASPGQSRPGTHGHGKARHGTVPYHHGCPVLGCTSSLDKLIPRLPGFRAVWFRLSFTAYTYDLHSVSPRSSSLPNPQSCLRVSRVCSSGALARPRVSPLVLFLESQLPSRRAPAQYTTFDDIYETSIHLTRF